MPEFLLLPFVPFPIRDHSGPSTGAAPVEDRVRLVGLTPSLSARIGLPRYERVRKLLSGHLRRKNAHRSPKKARIAKITTTKDCEAGSGLYPFPRHGRVRSNLLRPADG